MSKLRLLLLSLAKLAHFHPSTSLHFGSCFMAAFDSFQSIYAISEKKLLMCLPFKSGRTTWQIILAKNFKTNEEAEERGILAGKDFLAFKNTSDMISQDVLDQYKDYYKILLTRHPIDKYDSTFLLSFSVLIIS